MWPDQRSIKPLLRPFLTYLAPWRTPCAAPPLAAGGFAAAPGHSALTAHLSAHVTDLVHRVHWTESSKGGPGELRWAWGRLVGPVEDWRQQARWLRHASL